MKRNPWVWAGALIIAAAIFTGAGPLVPTYWCQIGRCDQQADLMTGVGTYTNVPLMDNLSTSSNLQTLTAQFDSSLFTQCSIYYAYGQNSGTPTMTATILKTYRGTTWSQGMTVVTATPAPGTNNATDLGLNTAAGMLTGNTVVQMQQNGSGSTRNVEVTAECR